MNVSWNKAKDVNHRQASEYQKQKKQTYKIQTGKQILETKKSKYIKTDRQAFSDQGQLSFLGRLARQHKVF